MTNDYGILFPTKKVTLGECGSVSMKPLSIGQLNFLAESFTKVMETVQNTAEGDYTVIIRTCYKELLDLLPYCLENPDVLPMIPAEFLPTLLIEFIELNLNKEVLARFLLLYQRIQQTIAQVKEISSPQTD